MKPRPAASDNTQPISTMTTMTTLPAATGLVLVIVGLSIHAWYIKDHLSRHRLSSSVIAPISSKTSSHDQLSSGMYGSSDYTPPPLFIYRRTKKTGSSSMLAVLLPQLVNEMGYEPLYLHRGAMEVAVRSEFISEHPRRLFIAEHNRITRMFHPKRMAVIADTVRDGYSQMTSFCRYVKKIKSCDDSIATCLKSSDALNQIRYRWAERDQEDDDTYIDLPLSAKHSALSTTIIRTVFPNITLDLTQQYNKKYSTCPERKIIRQTYQEHYQPLEKQIEKLKKRMLTIAGYPFKAESQFKMNITIDDMLNAADALEMSKYPQLMRKSSSGKNLAEINRDIHKCIRN